MKKFDVKNIRLGALFYNDKFVIIFSFILAFILWLTISSLDGDSRAITISDIPISIELSNNAIDDGLRVFSGKDTTAKISVTGNRLVIGQLTSSDIQIVALQASNITYPGNYTLELTAQKVGRLKDYSFASQVSPGFITVSVDRYREAEFEIEDSIQYKSSPEYFAPGVSFPSQSVVVSGPESEISKIKRVVAKYELSDILTSTTVVNVPLIMYDSYGEVISSDQIELSSKEIEATIPILQKIELPINVDIINGPENVGFIKNRMKITPSNVNIAVPTDMVESIKNMSLISLDFSNVNASNNKFVLDINLPIGCRNLSNNNTASININMSQLNSKRLNISDFVFSNLPENKQASVDIDAISVLIWGLDTQIKSLSSSNIKVEIDMKDKENFVGHTEMSAKIIINNKDTCWAYGNYNVNMQVYEKT